MRRANRRILVIIALVCIYFVACKQTDKTTFLTYSQFVQLKVGKYIIYKLDSTITAPFGASFIKRSFLIKDSIVEKFLDNENRESYKIYRYQYDPLAKVWNSSNTFFITPLDTRLEYVENNQRYIKMINPVSEFKTWQGNNYISGSMFFDGNIFQTWTYHYKDINQPAKIGAFNFDKTVTIVQYDSVDNTPFNVSAYNQYNKSYEIYADSIGLVYKDILSWEYQAFTNISNCKLIKPKVTGALDTSLIDCNVANCDSLSKLPKYKILCDTSLTNFYYTGYGTTQSIVSHN